MPRRISVLICAAAVLAPAQILRPLDRTAVEAEPLSIVAPPGAKLSLDGKAVAAGVPIALTPGMHELTLGREVVKFFAGPNAPPDFKRFRTHPPAAACGTCHVARTGGGDIKAGACFACHNVNAFPKKHTHNAQVLEDCAACHAPHGSAEAFHLKLTKETACKLCHG